MIKWKPRTAEGVGTGWKPGLKAPQDYIFEDRSNNLMKTMDQLRSAKNLVRPELIGPRRDQHAEGSCVGHGTAASANRIVRQDQPKTNDKTVYSPRFLYNMARILEDSEVDYDARKIVKLGEAIKFDDGAYVKNGVLGLRRFGACLESKWKYRAHIKEGDSVPGANDFKLVPTESRMQDAFRMHVEAQRCETIEGILSALLAGFPVVYGHICHTGMWTPEVDRTGVWPIPTSRDKEDGGHCECGHFFNLDMTVPGSDTPGVIFTENSWSEAWAPQSPSGIAGFSSMPLMYFKRNWADDVWAVVTEVQD